MPQFLARCKETNPLTTGEGEQRMKIPNLPAGAPGVSDFIVLKIDSKGLQMSINDNYYYLMAT